MKNILCGIVFFVLLLVSSAVNAQSKKHRIVFDMTSDSSMHPTLMLQLNNLLVESPDAEVEVVCYGPGLFMLVNGRTKVEADMKAIIAKGSVRFVACANSMKRNNIKKEDLISLAGIVPVALLELSSKQMDGWAHLKKGSF